MAKNIVIIFINHLFPLYSRLTFIPAYLLTRPDQSTQFLAEFIIKVSEDRLVAGLPYTFLNAHGHPSAEIIELE